LFAHLAPEIVGALLAGRHPIELTPTRLLRLSKNLPDDWKEQRRGEVSSKPDQWRSEDVAILSLDQLEVAGPRSYSLWIFIRF
jgi:hypothetical protein